MFISLFTPLSRLSPGLYGIEQSDNDVGSNIEADNFVDYCVFHLRRKSGMLKREYERNEKKRNEGKLACTHGLKSF